MPFEISLSYDLWFFTIFYSAAGHYFIKLLEEKGKLSKYFTQNIDGLERIAGIKVGMWKIEVESG